MAWANRDFIFFIKIGCRRCSQVMWCCCHQGLQLFFPCCSALLTTWHQSSLFQDLKMLTSPPGPLCSRQEEEKVQSRRLLLANPFFLVSFPWNLLQRLPLLCAYQGMAQCFLSWGTSEIMRFSQDGHGVTQSKGKGYVGKEQGRKSTR